MSSSNGDYALRRRQYRLPTGVYRGPVTLLDGRRVQIEFIPDVGPGSVSDLPHLQDALVYIAARVAETSDYNFIRIRSIFHSTTIRDGEYVPDRLHMTFDAREVVNGVVVEGRTGHAYIDGFVERGNPDLWYRGIVLSRVRWDTDRGSSVGSGSSRSGRPSTGQSSHSSARSASHRTTHGSGSERRSGSRSGSGSGSASGHGSRPGSSSGHSSGHSSRGGGGGGYGGSGGGSRPSSSQGSGSSSTRPNGWYTDPSGRYAERWFEDGEWTGHVRS